jgi:O-antigen/teichoic acid export membrane protein
LSLVAQVISAGILIIAARQSTFTQFATLISVLAVSAILVALIDFGSNSQWLVQLSKKQISLMDWKKLAGEKIGLGLAFTSLIVLTAFFFGANSIQVAFLFFFQLIQQTLYVYLKVTNQNKILSTSTVLDRFFALGSALILFGNLKEAGEILFLPFLIGSVLASFFTIIFILKVHFPAPRLTSASGTNWLASSSFGALSVIGALRNLDVLLLGVVGGSSQSALYGSVSKWSMPLVVSAGAVGTVSTPVVARLGINRSSLRLLLGSISLLGLALLGAALIAINAEFFVVILLGEKYANSADILRLTILAGLFLAVNQIFNAWLQALDKDKAVAQANISIVVLQLAMIVIFASNLGGVGAALALLLSQAALMIWLGTLLFRAVVSRKN